MVVILNLDSESPASFLSISKKDNQSDTQQLGSP